MLARKVRGCAGPPGSRVEGLPERAGQLARVPQVLLPQVPAYDTFYQAAADD
jgi:hypothetical protein